MNIYIYIFEKQPKLYRDKKKSNYLKDCRKSNMSNMNDAYILQFQFADHIKRKA